MTTEIKQPTHCERCHRETSHLIRSMEGSTLRFVCDACLYRQEKNINLKDKWQREGQRRNKR